MLDEVKSYLKITWDYEDGDIERCMRNGKARLENLAGTLINFETDYDAQSLLFDYCRYAYNSALEYFEANFAKEILSLQLRLAVNKNEG